MKNNINLFYKGKYLEGKIICYKFNPYNIQDVLLNEKLVI